MPRLGEVRLDLIQALGERYGLLPPPGGGPSFAFEPERSPFESIAAVALGLVADERVARQAFEVLRGAGLLDPVALGGINPLELDEIFQQARLRLTAKALGPLRKLARWGSERELDPDSFAVLSTETIREAWRGLSGVGPATADSLLLFGLRRASYPVDRASYRILVRHGWLDPSSDYDEARSVLESIAPDDPDQLAQISLAFEKLGREACKAGIPRCDRCPLQRFLPDSGPIEQG